ncbi:glycosyltransferase [Sulfitobacter sp. JB4-11]|uniref:glycosyltransferase n=1 Tax=Sulfitobacter rhodophyticola TaxID=3238304 RepID=UPI0035126F64
MANTGGGMMRETPEDKPLVTFALFAYQQEAYIREAIEGAFAQTYEPLEIILSDDCSTDRTFEIMQEMAEAYDGPHRVISRQSKKNAGLLKHVCSISQLIRGRLIVLAAGDDISDPNRTAQIASIWSCDTLAVYSACTLIDSNGNILEQKWIPNRDAEDRMPWLKAIRTEHFVYGASSSYSAEVFKSLKEPEDAVMSEDLPLNLLCQLAIGKIEYIPNSLVQYRLHGNTLSNSNIQRCSIKNLNIEENKSFEKYEREIRLLNYLEERILKLYSDEYYDQQMLHSRISALHFKISWRSMNRFRRILDFPTVPRGLRKWALARLFGKIPYLCIKFLSVRFSRGLDELK